MSQGLANAIALFRAGRLPEAEAELKRLLQSSPWNPDIYNLLGIVAGSGGRHAEAAHFMTRSVELAPTVPEYRNNLARALLQSGRHEAAESLLRGHAENNIASPDFALLWSAVLSKSGRTEEAVQWLEKSLKLNPSDPMLHFRLATVLRHKGDTKSSAERLKRLLEIKPDFAEALNDLAGLQMSEGEFLDALATIQRLLQVSPRSAQAYCNLASLLAAAGDFLGAVTALRNASTIQPDSPRIRFQLAKTLVQLGNLSEAESIVTELASNDVPQSVSVKALQAMILERRGDIQGAVEVLESVRGADSGDADIAILKAIVLEQQGKLSEAAETIEALLQSNRVAAVEGIGLYFTLGQLYDSLGRYDEAFEAFTIGNRNRKSAFIKAPTNPSAVASVSDKVRELYSSHRFHSCPDSGLRTHAPIFILGMPRSGTTLIEQILSTHSQVHAAGELTALHDCLHQSYRKSSASANSFVVVAADPSAGNHCIVPNGWDSIDSNALAELGEAYLKRVGALPVGATRFTDKMPYNFYLAGLITKLFPRARIIHCKRHPLDTCLSCYFQNFATGSQYSFDLAELGEFYREYVKIMEFWRDELRVPMLEVDYEEMVEQPEICARRIVEYCGLEWEAACLEFHRSKRAVSTASYQQVRRPIYTKSAGRWRNYARHIGPLIQALGRSDRDDFQ